MKREYPDRPIVGVGAVIVDRNRVLLVRRAAEPLKGQWSVPGGVVELGETLRGATVREALEETGLAVEAGEVLDVFDSIFSGEDGRIAYHYVLVDFRCSVTGGELRAGSDAEEVRWVSFDELEALDMTPATKSLLQRAITTPGQT